VVLDEAADVTLADWNALKAMTVGQAPNHFKAFVEGVHSLVYGKALDKGYANEDDGSALRHFVDKYFPGHALGEVVYKAVRYAAKRDPADLLKIAAWAFLVYRDGPKAGQGSGPSMTLDDFQREAESTLSHSPDQWPGGLLPYHALGLAEEAGEVVGKVKKALRRYERLDSPGVKQAVLTELGDVLWYMAAMCHDMGCTLQQVADINIKKRADRQSRGVIKGEGDDR
jgi:NTP pyrophosphatase (non-canonical NTP hydrolase)